MTPRTVSAAPASTPIVPAQHVERRYDEVEDVEMSGDEDEMPVVTSSSGAAGGASAAAPPTSSGTAVNIDGESDVSVEIDVDQLDALLDKVHQQQQQKA